MVTWQQIALNPRSKRKRMLERYMDARAISQLRPYEPAAIWLRNVAVMSHSGAIDCLTQILRIPNALLDASVHSRYFSEIIAYYGDPAILRLRFAFRRRSSPHSIWLSIEWFRWNILTESFPIRLLLRIFQYRTRCKGIFWKSLNSKIVFFFLRIVIGSVALVLKI